MVKTFMNSHRTTKFAKVFSLESFLLYGSHPLLHYSFVNHVCVSYYECVVADHLLVVEHFSGSNVCIDLWCIWHDPSPSVFPTFLFYLPLSLPYVKLSLIHSCAFAYLPLIRG